jgi:hypothetical protein
MYVPAQPEDDNPLPLAISPNIPHLMYSFTIK